MEFTLFQLHIDPSDQRYWVEICGYQHCGTFWNKALFYLGIFKDTGYFELMICGIRVIWR